MLLLIEQYTAWEQGKEQRAGKGWDAVRACGGEESRTRAKLGDTARSVARRQEDQGKNDRMKDE